MATVICVVSLKRPREFDGLSGQPTTESTETVGGRHLSIITWHFLETALHPRQRPYNFFLFFFFSTGGGDRPNGAVWSGGSARQRRGTAFYFHFHTVSTFAAAYHFWRFNRLKISLFFVTPPPPPSLLRQFIFGKSLECNSFPNEFISWIFNRRIFRNISWSMLPADRWGRNWTSTPWPRPSPTCWKLARTTIVICSFSNRNERVLSLFRCKTAIIRYM